MKMRSHYIYIVSADKPGPPEAPEIKDVTKTSCLVTWQPPKQDGGSPVTGYHVERRITSSPRWIKINKAAITELQLKVTDLIEGNEYEFRIMAENKIGVGPPSSPCPPFLAKDAFGKHIYSGSCFAFTVIPLISFEFNFTTMSISDYFSSTYLSCIPILNPIHHSHLFIYLPGF